MATSDDASFRRCVGCNGSRGKINRAAPGSDYCKLHDPELAEARKANGGKRYHGERPPKAAKPRAKKSFFFRLPAHPQADAPEPTADDLRRKSQEIAYIVTELLAVHESLKNNTLLVHPVTGRISKSPGTDPVAASVMVKALKATADVLHRERQLLIAEAAEAKANPERLPGEQPAPRSLEELLADSIPAEGEVSPH